MQMNWILLVESSTLYAQFWLHHSETTSISSSSIANNLNGIVVDNKSVKKKFPSITFSFLKNLCGNHKVEFRCTNKQIYKSMYYVIIREITNLHNRVRVEISHFQINSNPLMYGWWQIICIYRVLGNWWYKRKKGDSTRKKKSKIQNKNFSFEALFSRKSNLNFRSVRVHFITSRYNGSHRRSLSRSTLCW